jgi:hypothetical protein
MFRKPYYLIPVALAVCLVQNASGQYNWSGADNNGLWSDPNNWVQLVVPPASAGDIFVDPVTYTGHVIIGASDVVQNAGTLQGPEWGQTLDIYGTVIDGYALSTVGSLTGPTSVLNLYGNGSVTAGDSFFVGEPWWAAGIQNATVNLYGNSQATAKYVIVSGHLNIYGGTVTALNGFLTGTATTGGWGSPLVTDASRLIDIAGGKLIVVGDITAQVNDLIARGILEGNGVVGNVNIDLLSDPGFTVITAVPEPASVALLGLGGFAMMLVFRRRSGARA